MKILRKIAHQISAIVLSPKTIAICIPLLVVLWVVSGTVKPTTNTNTLSTAERIIPQVKTKISVAQAIQRTATLYGTTQSVRTVNIKTEAKAKVTNILADEGSVVKSGDVILTLDKKDINAKITELRALVKQRKLEYKVAKTLSKTGHQTETKLLQADTALKAAKAKLLSAKIDLQHTTIIAPFDGILQKIHVEEGDYVDGLQTNIATILDHDSFIVVGHVPEKIVGKIKMGTTSEINTVSGINAIGIITYISRVADPNTRTFKVEVEVPNDSYNLQEGVTSEIHIPLEVIDAHVISSSAFALSEDGSIGVKVINNDGIVKFYPIVVIKENDAGMWISGLPHTATIITSGQAYLRVGDKAMANTSSS